MRVLLLGGTGAIGRNLAALLLGRGCSVYVTSRSPRISSSEGLYYLQGDATESSFILEVLKCKFDVVVDFMVRPSKGFEVLADVIIKNCSQYIFISSYRAIADAWPLTEKTPLLIDACEDDAYLKSHEYALEKGRCEKILRNIQGENWTIIRPGITFDDCGRFQLGCYEANVWLWRSLKGLSVPMPEEMLNKVTTLTSGYDVARMIACLAGNTAAFGKAYLAASAEFVTWKDVSNIYKSIVPLKLIACSLEEYRKVTRADFQIKYDRMLDRRVDNSAILEACGLVQEDLTPCSVGLAESMKKFISSNRSLAPSVGMNARIDHLVGERSLVHMNISRSLVTYLKYCYGLVRR